MHFLWWLKWIAVVFFGWTFAGVLVALGLGALISRQKDRRRRTNGEWHPRPENGK